MELKNIPNSAYKFEFIVCEKVDNELWFRGSYPDGWEAEQACQKIKNGIIVHNIRVQNFKK